MELEKVIQQETDRLLTVDDLLEAHNISKEDWKITKQVVNSWENASKDGEGNVTITPLFQIKAFLESRKIEKSLEAFKQEFMYSLKKQSPVVKKISYKKQKDAKLLQINVFDLHLGKFSWDEETGESYDLSIAEKLFSDSIEYFVNVTSPYSVEKILLPIGNDFFNSDKAYPFSATTNGTPQENDRRWQEVFRRGRELVIKNVDLLTQIAPVEIVMVPGNHDFEKVFYLGDALECWYHNNKNVTVNNSASPRKYFSYHNILIGFTHGNNEKITDLPLIMAQEQPENWSKSKYREFHIGHWHHKKDIKYMSTNEYSGIKVRYMSSVSATDAWHHSKGFIGSNRGSEAYLWDRGSGLTANFYFNC